MASWNVIDRVPDPEQLLAEQKRCLKSGGTLCMTDPYNWLTKYTPRDKWIGGRIDREPSSSPQAVRDWLKKTMSVVGEENDLLWLFWDYWRQFYLISNHAIVARKSGNS